MKINLTDKETEIFNQLLSINEKYDLKLTFRVAGGWVRDKILGNESDDIDISLDKMTGQEFCKFVRKELNVNVHIIEEKHDQCKHLEVACIKLSGIDIDILHLRSEEYNDTRIPTVKIGTPKEDAMRRGLTINAMFYNINTNEIEDFTGKGLNDIKNKIIRTPLDPYQTFMDDPLRILRAIRFTTRLNFKLENNIIETVNSNPEIRTALINKVSPERRLTELRKTINHNAIHALNLMKTMNIFDDLFNVSMSPTVETYIHNNIQNTVKMNIVMFLSLIYFDQLQNNININLDKLKITKKEKNDTIKLINSINEHKAILEQDNNTVVRCGRLILGLETLSLLEMSNYLIEIILKDTDISEHLEVIRSLKWVINMKPVLNGNDIMKLYNVRGKQVKEIMDKIIDLQITNKNYTKEWVTDNIII